MSHDAPHDIIAALQDLRTHKDRRDLLERVWYAGNRDFFLGLRAALDPLVDYGVVRAPEYELDGSESAEDLTGGSLTWAAFAALLDKLATRTLAGDAAIDAITEAAGQAGMLEWNLWFRRILLRDLRCGVTAKMVNQSLKKIGRNAAAFRIATLDLPQPVPVDRNRGGVMGKKYLEPQLVGRRVAVLVRRKAGLVRVFDEAGEVLETPVFCEALLKIDDLKVDVLLDGWLTGVSFRSHMGTAALGESHLALFDIVPLDAYRTGYCPTALRDRARFLSSLQGGLQHGTGGAVWVLPKLLVDTTTPDGRANLTDFREECHGAGYDAVIVKDPEAGYGDKAANWIAIQSTDKLGFLG